MSALSVGDRVRVTDVSAQEDKTLTVGDIGTVVEILTEPKALIQALYGRNVPLFVHVEDKPNGAGQFGETNWPLLDSEVEKIAEEAA